MTRRVDRINGLLRQEISWLLSHTLKDPRISGVVSITKVDTAADLRHAKIFVSVMGDPHEKQEKLQGIESATGFMRRELRTSLSLRYVPELKFVLDESIEDAEHLFSLLNGTEGLSENHSELG